MAPIITLKEEREKIRKTGYSGAKSSSLGYHRYSTLLCTSVNHELVARTGNRLRDIGPAVAQQYMGGNTLSTSCEMCAIIHSWQQQCNCCPFVLVNVNI